MSGSEQPDFAAFAAFEHEGWSRVAAAYSGSFGRCTSLAVEPLLDVARVASGTRVLDLACGPGFAAAAASARGAKACALDFSAAMVARARAACPGADVREGDAAALPWPDGTFDAVVCNFGVNHFPDVERALLETHRVLAPGGRLAFTVWDSIERSSGQRLLNDAIAAHGRLDVPIPASPPAHRFADVGEARRALTASGFVDVNTSSFDVPLAGRTGSDVLEIFRSGTVRLGALLQRQSEADLVRIRAVFERSLEPWRSGEGVAVPMRVVLTSASKP